jgi:hypothetical protein
MKLTLTNFPPRNSAEKAVLTSSAEGFKLSVRTCTPWAEYRYRQLTDGSGILLVKGIGWLDGAEINLIPENDGDRNVLKTPAYFRQDADMVYALWPLVCAEGTILTEANA